MQIQADEPYRSEGFLKIPASVELNAVSGVAIGPGGRIYVLHRGEPTLLSTLSSMALVSMARLSAGLASPLPSFTGPSDGCCESNRCQWSGSTAQRHEAHCAAPLTRKSHS